MAAFEIKWQAPEFEYRPKGVSWYWTSIIVSIIILTIAVWQKDFLFGFFIVVAETLVLVWSTREPRMVDFSLTDNGLWVGQGNVRTYAEMESFSIESEEVDWPNLIIQFRKRLKTPLKIKVPRRQKAEIQKVLKTVLPEVDYETPLLDNLQEFIGF